MSGDQVEQQDSEYYRRAVGPAVNAAAAYYGVSSKQVYAHGRAKTASSARQVAMYLSRIVLGFSYPEIGKAFDRDHTTVMSACKKVTELRVGDRRYNVAIEKLQKTVTVSGIESTTSGALTAVSFPDKVWEKLKEVRESGMFGESMTDVIIRLVALKLYEMGK